MNEVDQFDQFRNTSATQRKKARHEEHSDIRLRWKYCKRSRVAEGHTKRRREHNNVRTMKHHIIIHLVREHVQYKQERAERTPISTAIENHISLVKKSTLQPHILLETVCKKRLHCILCKLLFKGERGRYNKLSGVECRQRFHVKCFSFFHHKEIFRETIPDIFDAISAVQRSLASRYRREPFDTPTSTLEAAHVLRNKCNYSSLNHMCAPLSSGQRVWMPSSAHWGIWLWFPFPRNP